MFAQLHKKTRTAAGIYYLLSFTYLQVCDAKLFIAMLTCKPIHFQPTLTASPRTSIGHFLHEIVIGFAGL